MPVSRSSFLAERVIGLEWLSLEVGVLAWRWVPARVALLAVSDCCVGKAAFDGFRVGGGELDCVVGVRREVGWVGAGGWRGGRRSVEAID